MQRGTARLSPGFASKLNLALDLAVLVAAIAGAALLAGSSVPLQSRAVLWFVVGAFVTWVVTSTALRYYDPWSLRTAPDDAAMATVIVLAAGTVLALLDVLLPDALPRPHVGHILMMLWPTAMAVRLLVARPLATRDAPLGDVLVVGIGALGRRTAETIKTRRRRLRLAGFLRLPTDPDGRDLGALLLGDASHIAHVLAVHPVEEVYIAGNPMRDGAAMQAVVRTCETFGLPFALPAYNFRLDRAQPADPNAVFDGYLHYVSVHTKPAQRAFKRLFDIVLSATALWLLLPLLLAVALAIKLTSRGPVLFKQVRVGLHGRVFHMLKFRSMVVDAEQQKAKLVALNEQSGPVFKMRNDPRVTAVGRFIRKFSIDELPQLINVLRGDMSIVGPRPPVPSEVAKYEAWQRRRLSVRPGLTCIWQVSGRNQISFDDWMYLDMQYIDHWTLRGDLELIARTVPVVLTGRGAS